MNDTIVPAKINPSGFSGAKYFLTYNGSSMGMRSFADLPQDIVPNTSLIDNSITNVKIADLTLDYTKISNGGIRNVNLEDLTI